MHDLQRVHQCTCLKYGHIHTESGVGVLCPHSPHNTIRVFHRTQLCASESAMPGVHVGVCGRTWIQGSL